MGDGFSLVEHCENVDLTTTKHDTTPDADTIFCEDDPTVLGVFDYSFVGEAHLSDMLMTRKGDRKQIRLKLGSNGWRVLHFTAFRQNSEQCSATSSTIPWDVQNTIANFVWESQQ